MKILSALAAALLLLPLPASAAVPWQVDVPQHLRLVTALEHQGIDVSWGSQYCDGNNSGTYNAQLQTIKICSNGDRWVADNFDTLRHEAIHALQDLRDCKLGDLRLNRLSDDDQLADAASRTNLDITAIIDAYAERGASEHVIMLELEAWVGASTTSAGNLAEILEDTTCR